MVKCIPIPADGCEKFVIALKGLVFFINNVFSVVAQQTHAS